MSKVLIASICCLGLIAACSDDSDKPVADAGIADLARPDGPLADSPLPGDHRVMLDGPVFLDLPVLPDSTVADSVAPDSAVPDTIAMCGKIACDCTLNGIPLYGKVKEVTAFADFKVREVTAFEDLKVQQVSAFANSCGKWEFITLGIPDFTVQFVTMFEDFSIRYVTAFPGLP